MEIPDIEDLELRKSHLISCSRRTDIPAFYMNEILESLKKGYIVIPHKLYPRIKTDSKISLSSTDVVGFVWWSKNYSKWINLYEQSENKQLLSKYTHMFNFTINSESELEPNVLPLTERFNQVKWLSDTFTSEAMKCRFDPIVFYCRNDEPEIVLNNLKDFAKVVKFISGCGITELIFSFCLSYSNVKKHMEKSGFTLIDLDIQKKREITVKLANICRKHNVKLCSCSETQLNGIEGLYTSVCVDGITMEKLSGKEIKDKKKDTGQRKKCNCTTSRDIGRYDWKCAHSCAYCYANPELC
jgi:hypothetical protein